MKLSTLDLYYHTLCPMRAKLSPSKEEEISPARELIKRVFLLRAIGRKTGWTIKGIANVWDELFWKGKEITRANMDDSIKGVLSARTLYNKLPKEGFSIHSTKELSLTIDSSVEVHSSGDFLLEYPDRYETWIYKKWNHKNARRTVLPQAEHLLVQRCISEDKPFFINFYYVNTSRLHPITFRVGDENQEELNSKVITHICDQVRKGISYPVEGPYCSTCEIDC